MKVLIRNANIIDPASEYHGQMLDIYLEADEIKAIGKALDYPEAMVVETEGLCVSPGWIDIGVQGGDPGFEHREDIQSVSDAAAAGGYTGIGMFPNTQPVIHSKSEVNYLVRNSEGHLVDLLPIGAVTESCNGHDITEMIDMHKAGAIAFSDGALALQNNGMMMRALQYVKAFDGVVINRPHDSSIAGDGQLHEGIVSTMLGTKGIPHMAEEMMVQRDIYLADYTHSRVHIAFVSSARSVELIRQAKAKGIQVTCSVAALNLLFTDEALQHFNSNFKVLPPLREKSDIEGLIEGLKDGTIDMISSNHVPLESERKELEFHHAEQGAIGLQTTYALANEALSGIFGQGELIEKLAHQPRAIFGLEKIVIQEGGTANLTLFVPDASWKLERSAIRSRSYNSPLIGRELKGRIVGVIHNDQSYFS